MVLFAIGLVFAGAAAVSGDWLAFIIGLVLAATGAVLDFHSE